MARWPAVLICFLVFISFVHSQNGEQPIGGEPEKDNQDGTVPIGGDEPVIPVTGDESLTPAEPKPSSSDNAVKEEDSVLVLTNDNFDSVTSSSDVVLVEFYAPWCGHCKQLAPEYKKAAVTLKADAHPVVLGTVDATVEKDLASRFEVQGYPTLFWFKKGEKLAYDGPRDEHGIVNYMRERADPSWKPPPPAVLTLTKDNFDETVNKEDIILVEFYAPWCGHCKKLEPEYEKAAKMLKEHDPPVPLAKVDATQEPDLAQRYSVTGYPTLKMFRKGRASEYKGPREERGIVEHMTKQIGQASKELKSAKDIQNHMKIDDITIIGFFENDEDSLYETYIDASNDLRDDYTFGHSFDSSARETYKVNPGSIVVLNANLFYTKFEKQWYILDKADATAEDVKKFIDDHRVPLVGHIHNENEHKRFKARPLCLIFYTIDWGFDHRDATQAWRLKFADVAKDYRDITFAIADEGDFERYLKDFGLDDTGEEVNIGCFDAENRRFPMDPMEEYDADDFREFLDKFKTGKLKPHLKSQPTPKKQGPVKVVVGNTFDDIVLDPTKDVLLELYAPWCGHCKQLEPNYKKLAKKLKDDNDIVIAKIDATANDVPPEYKGEGFPTIFFAPANKKDSPIKYEKNEKDVDDFIKFMQEHAVVSFGKKGKDEL